MAVNQHGDTPYHVAARCRNPAVMDAMLKTFPSCCFVKDNIGDGYENAVISQLLNICACRGNAPAVSHLIRCGADLESSDVMREIVGESVRKPCRIKLLLEVYYTIVDHAVLWWCYKIGRKMPRPDSSEYKTQKRHAVLHLLTKNNDKNNMSVVEYAIDAGASQCLRAIVNTRDVFRFVTKGKDGKTLKRVKYDVTDMTPFTMSFEANDNKSPR